MRVLLVEDDNDLAEVVLLGLRQEHLAVDHAPSLLDAEDHLAQTHYDILCLDLGMPDGDGLDLCRRLHGPSAGILQRPHRTLILTARDAVRDRVAGLDAGADDYLIKPFKVVELAARIRALSRRNDQPPETFSIEDLQMNVVSHTVTRSNTEVDLTGREYAVLRYFCAHAGEVVSAEELLVHCWDANADPFTGSVRVILSRLRRKLGDPAIIHTIKGTGYRLGDPR